MVAIKARNRPNYIYNCNKLKILNVFDVSNSVHPCFSLFEKARAAILAALYSQVQSHGVEVFNGVRERYIFAGKDYRSRHICSDGQPFSCFFEPENVHKVFLGSVMVE